MFKRMLVPLDGSGRAERALPIAAHLARASGGSILLVRVVSTEPASLPSAPKPILIQPSERQTGCWPRATWQGWLALIFSAASLCKPAFLLVWSLPAFFR